MSTLHRLKAYFGMVPADELDSYGADYDEDYDDYDTDGDESRTRSYPSERMVSRRPRRAAFDDYDGRRYERIDEGFAEPEVAAPRAPRRPGWAPEPTPARGALAMDTAPPLREPLTRKHPFAEEDHPLARIVTLHPRTYNEARPIGERYREGTPVIMNLTEMDDADAKRLVDFAAGLAFALRGSIDKVTTKVFLLSPANVAVSAEDKRRIAEGGFFNQS